MATMVLPIRELSADVQLRAASVQKRFLDIAEAKAQAVHNDMMMTLKSHVLNRSMARLVGAQERLIRSLEDFPVQELSAEAVGKVAGDLERLVSGANSLLDDIYQMPEPCLGLWRPKLEAMADLNGHIDNYAESFRIAFDDACSAVLAEMATKITAREEATLG